MNPTTSMKYWIFLQQVLGQGSRKLPSLLEEFRTARGAYEAGPRGWESLGLFTPAELARLDQVDLNRCEEIVKYCWRRGYDIVTPNDKRYPLRLVNLPNPPAALYVKGEFPEIDDHVVLSVVGTRKCSESGKKITRDLCQRLAASGAMIVSGGALGIDSSAHIGAIRAGGKTVAVLGCGLDYPYLSANEDLREDIAAHGALISEYPPKSPVTKYKFPVRNRLISGLGLGTIVVEATRRSGALITVDHALEQGKDVFVVPGSISDPLYAGSNRLIRDGAKAVTSPFDILEEYTGYYPHRIDLAGCEIPIEDDADELRPAAVLKESSDAPKKKKRPPRSSRRPKAEKKPRQENPSRDDLLAKLRLNYPLLSENAKTLFAAFVDAQTENFDVAISRSELDSSAAIAALTELEIFGFLEAIPGGRYAVNTFQEVTDV